MLKWIIAGALLLLTVAAAATAWKLGQGDVRSQARTPVPTVADARRMFEAQRYDAALRLAEQVLQQREAPEALMVAGESATKLGKFQLAIDYYNRIPDSASQAAIARWATGEIEFHLGHASRAIAALERSLQLDPELADAHDRLIWLYNTFGRRWETLPHLLYMLQTGQFNVDHLLLIGNLAKEYEDLQQVKRFLAADPEDPLPYLALGRSAMNRGEYDQALQHLQLVAERMPDLAEAHAQLGLLFLKAFPERLPQWSGHLPKSAESHPDVWYVRGQWLSGEYPEQAIGCLAEAVRIDPNHLKAHQSLAQMFHRLDQTQLAESAARRARLLQELNIALEQIYKARTYQPLLREAAELTLKLGRLWETRGWCTYAAMLDRSQTWPMEVMAQAEALLPPGEVIPHTLPSHRLIAQGDWASRYPPPEAAWWEQLTSAASSRKTQQQPLQTVAPRFREVTDSAGIRFTFDNNSKNQIDGRRIFETTGGGIGVLDYDCDGWPDLYLVQAGALDSGVPSKENPTDRLYRHLGDGQIAWYEVTEMARIEDYQFGQGTTIADVDGDGFDDIYVCNIGRNQLWLNMGDGTFTAAGQLLPESAAWTCSAVAVDFDLDGVCEIYDVNYVQGPDVFSRLCPVGGKARSCSPLVFQPTPDRLLISRDGRYNSIPMPSMIGNGLGAVAFRVASERNPSVFVAVDQQANLFGRFVPADDHWTLEDEAILSGLAYDLDGNAQACMGIATGDVDHDGDVDLYVTNFYLEYNTLYVQEPSGFLDATAASGTEVHTKPMLAFGTEMLDAQLDGELDIIVLNGHVDDHTHTGVPEAMVPQLFQGVGGGRFELVEAEQAGDFFTRPRIGRALAVLDADGDGDYDFVAGSLEQPLAVVENVSPHVGLPLVVRLVGVASDRNALTAIATLEAGEYRQVQQLVAGGGYQVTNQRQLAFAVPHDTPALTLTVEWPSGQEQVFNSLHPGNEYTVIEGAPEAVLSRRLRAAD